MIASNYWAYQRRIDTLLDNREHMKSYYILEEKDRRKLESLMLRRNFTEAEILYIEQLIDVSPIRHRRKVK